MCNCSIDAMFALTRHRTRAPDRHKDERDMALANDLLNVDFGLKRRIVTIIAEFRETRQRRRVYQQTLRELKTLSNRELNDLGIARSTITRVAYEAAYGK